MNFLAHLYCSFDDDDLLIGNFIADHVKGKQYKTHPEGIQRGILLHRHIDTYTDRHPEVEKTKKILRKTYRKYAPVISDIYYDHYLAANWAQYHDTTLPEFTKNAYGLLKEHREIMPSFSQLTLKYMSMHDWLTNYGKIEGIQRALNGMSRRAVNDSRMDEATRELELHYDEFAAHFHAFFPELVEVCRAWVKDNH